MWNRRQLLSYTGLGAIGVSSAALGFGLSSGDPTEKMPDGSQSRGMVTLSMEAAIEKGLAYLAREGRRGQYGTRSNYRGNVALSSLAGMAFLASGSQPGRGRYGKHITEALRYVLSQSRTFAGRFHGYLYNPGPGNHGPMYGHGFGTLFLGECYGMIHDKKLRKELHDKLGKAVNLIIQCQNREGGWRYHPTSNDADLSVTICQIMALRSARNAGFAVPNRVIRDCVQYVKNCRDRSDGSFRYQASRRGRGLGRPFARTGAGICALYSAGIYDGPEVESGLQYLLKDKPSGGRGGFFGNRENLQYFYGHYYATQAMWTAGGRYWNEWFPAIREELLSRQKPNGSWEDRIDTHYATAMACIILQIPNNYLPILQK